MSESLKILKELFVFFLGLGLGAKQSFFKDTIFLNHYIISLTDTCDTFEDTENEDLQEHFITFSFY